MHQNPYPSPHKGMPSSQPFEDFFSLLKQHPFLIGSIWLLLFAMLIVLSYVTGIMPAIQKSAAAPVVSVEASSSAPVAQEVETNDEPVRIIIDAIDVDTTIINPSSRDIKTLDAALMQGVVHYPGSGDLGDTSNMFLLGHSSGLRIVHNQAYKVFNGLKQLKDNDVIRVQSTGKEYLYRVKSVSMVNANEASVNLRSDVKMLTLATCNVFGAKEERYVVSAEFVGSYPIAHDSIDL